MTFDKLAYIYRLKAAGFTEPQTRALADGLDQALREKATEGDLLKAARASRRSVRTILFLLFAGQTAVFWALDLLGR
jgi:hypothetical protein